MNLFFSQRVIGLDLLDRGGYGKGCVSLGQNVDVVRDPTGFQETALLRAQHTTPIGVKLVPDVDSD